MSAPPKTVLAAPRQEEDAIRDAVRRADPATFGPGCVLAGSGHVTGVLELLTDPAVSDPIYDLPTTLSAESVAAWIADAEEQRRLGEGLLILTVDHRRSVNGYFKISVWPERSSAELAGALRADLQSAGAGGAGAAHAIDWIFHTLEVRLVCLTAAPDNVRSARLIDHMGFVRMGERDGVRADGTIRRSLYWEMTREEWLRRYAG